MTTRPYSECLAETLALCGIPDSSPVEVARIKVFINKRARRAFAESDYWPRFYHVGEERICSEDGLLPYAQSGKNTIKTCLRLHATEPFATCGASEYRDFVAENNGFQIQGYCPHLLTKNAPYQISTDFFLIPAIQGRYEYAGDVGPALNGDIFPFFRSTSNNDYYIYPSVIAITPTSDSSVRWMLGSFSGPNWTSGALSYDTPDAANGNYTSTNGAAGTPTVTLIPTYSVFVTYRSAFTEKYGDADGENPEVPEEWFGYMAYGAYADWLRSEGQQEKAAAADVEAYDQLLPSLEDLDRQSGSLVHTRTVNHTNAQAR